MLIKSYSHVRVQVNVSNSLHVCSKLVHPNLAVIFGILDPFSNKKQSQTCDISIIMEKTENNLLTCAIKKKDAKVRKLTEVKTDFKIMAQLIHKLILFDTSSNYTPLISI